MLYYSATPLEVLLGSSVEMETLAAERAILALAPSGCGDGVQSRLRILALDGGFVIVADLFDQVTSTVCLEVFGYLERFGRMVEVNLEPVVLLVVLTSKLANARSSDSEPLPAP